MKEYLDYQELNCEYGGSEKKSKVLYNGEIYMLKYPDPIRETKNELSYMNNQFSEYIGCHIYESVGIPVQDTILGRSYVEGKDRIVVLCKDFTYLGKSKVSQLYEMGNLYHSLNIDSKTALDSIEAAYRFFDKKPNLNRDKAITRFWDMFIIDCLLGNHDRHFNNIGFLENEEGILEPSPVYDCGSCLNALACDEDMNLWLNDEVEFKNKVYNAIASYKFEGKKIFYHEMFLSPNQDLIKSMVNIIPKIDMNEINQIIDEIPYISDVRKLYYKKSIRYRKEQILDKSYNRILKKELHRNKLRKQNFELSK